MIELRLVITSSRSFTINTNANNPLFASPLNEDADVCLNEITDYLVNSLVAVVGDDIIKCAASFKSRVSDIYKRVDSNREWSDTEALDFGYGMASMVTSCGKFAITFLGPQYRIMEGLLQTADILLGPAGNVSGIGKMADICSRNFGPNPFGKRTYPVRRIQSGDPNDKIGVGQTSKHHITGNEPIQYGIKFENISNATAAAQIVKLEDTLDISKLDLSSFQLNSFSFGGHYVQFQPGQTRATEYVDLRPKQNIILSVKAELNEKTGILTATYSSLDPLTLALTKDPLLGFLPPNRIHPEGEGSLYYTIASKTTLPSGEKISNRALIYFDDNDPIWTPVWTNIIDKKPPITYINELPSIVDNKNILLSWIGNDSESGIRFYNVYYSTDNKRYVPLITNTIQHTFNFTGKVDSTYYFYSLGIDSTSNVEPVKLTFDTKTTISQVLSTETKAGDFKVFHNPFYSTFEIQSPSKNPITRISLFDSQGHVLPIEFKSHGNDRYSVTTRQLLSGLYVLKLETVTGKIAINLIHL